MPARSNRIFWLNILLTILGYMPGIVHSVWVIAKYCRITMEKKLLWKHASKNLQTLMTNAGAEPCDPVKSHAKAGGIFCFG